MLDGVTFGNFAPYIVAAVSALWLLWEKVIVKRIDSKVENDSALTAAKIGRQKSKDLTESETLKDILSSYTKLNDNVFSLFQEYLTNIKKDSSDIKANVRMIKNFQDMFDRNFDETLKRLEQIETKLNIVEKDSEA